MRAGLAYPVVDNVVLTDMMRILPWGEAANKVAKRSQGVPQLMEPRFPSSTISKAHSKEMQELKGKQASTKTVYFKSS
jgi:hypothetical protein